MANPFAGGGENGVRDRGCNRRDGRFTHPDWAAEVARNDVRFDDGRIAHPCDFKVGVILLLGRAVAEGDLAF